jgi:hypothetical protein
MRSSVNSLGLANLSPASNESTFADWWEKVCKQVHKSKRRDFNSIIILGAWCLWLHRNKAVFDGVRPSFQGIKSVFLDEFESWRLAGARHLEAFRSWCCNFQIKGSIGGLVKRSCVGLRPASTCAAVFFCVLLFPCAEGNCIPVRRMY